jgi:hypothetical protein
MPKPPRQPATGSKSAGKSKADPAGADAGAAPGSKPAGTGGARRTPPNRPQSKKIVNQRQTPWGLIIATVVIVVLAAGVIGYAVSRGKQKKDLADPNKIPGIVHVSNLTRNHTTSAVKYAQSPPIGGDHSAIWADCTGTVYPNQIANENAVHALEHGAVWIAYKPGLAADQLDVLTKLVAGHEYTLMTPYAGLTSNISLQAWGYELPVDSATDSRVTRFVNALRLNQTNTPELGASCDNPTFKTTPSSPGKPSES